MRKTQIIILEIGSKVILTTLNKLYMPSPFQKTEIEPIT